MVIQPPAGAAARPVSAGRGVPAGDQRQVQVGPDPGLRRRRGSRLTQMDRGGDHARGCRPAPARRPQAASPDRHGSPGRPSTSSKRSPSGPEAPRRVECSSPISQFTAIAPRRRVAPRRPPTRSAARRPGGLDDADGESMGRSRPPPPPARCGSAGRQRSRACPRIRADWMKPPESAARASVRRPPPPGVPPNIMMWRTSPRAS